jgi:WD40 repeat protein
MHRSATVIVALLCLSLSPLQAQKKELLTPVDAYGDPLPRGVLARMGSVRLDCETDIQAASFDNEGKTLTVLTAAKQEQLWVVDVSTGKTISRTSLPKGAGSFAFTTDRRLLAVHVFDQVDDPNGAGVNNVQAIHVLSGTDQKPIWKTDSGIEFASMALSADGKYLAGGSKSEPGVSNDIIVWEATTGKQLVTLKGHLTTAVTLAFSPDGKKLFSFSRGGENADNTAAIRGSVSVWEMPSGKLLKEMPAKGHWWVFSPNGAIAAFRDVTKIHLWNLETDKLIAILPEAGLNYRFSPDGKTFASAPYKGMIRLWDAATGKEIRTFKGVAGDGTQPFAFSRDGKILATCSDHRSDTIRFWDVEKGTEIRPFGGHNVGISALAFAPDGTKLISGSVDQTSRVWETATGKELAQHEHKAGVTAVAFSSDGKTVASGDSSNTTHIWDSTTGKLLHTLESKLEVPRGALPATCILSFSPDGKTLWVGTRVFTMDGRTVTAEKGELVLYETATGKRIRSVDGSDNYPLAISPDGELSVWTGQVRPKKGVQAFGGWQENVVIRRLDNGRTLYQIQTGDDYRMDEVLEQVIFSPDSKSIALNTHYEAASFHRSAIIPCYRLVDVFSGKNIVNRESADYPWTIFPADGRVLAGSYRIELIMAPVGGMIRQDGHSLGVVDVVGKKVVGELPAHPMSTNAWAVAPNYKYFASADANHTILVWDLTQQGWKPAR